MKAKHWFEEGIVIFLILLNIFDFLRLLPADIDFVKKLISWTLLGYILYHVSITKQLFGEKRKWTDILLILVFFLLVSNQLVHFSHEVLEIAVEEGKETAVFTGLYNSIIVNEFAISYWSFYIGMMLIVLFSLYLTQFMHVHKPSLIETLHEHGIPKTIMKKVERFVVIFLLLCFFFLFVFNLMMEWLAIAVDSSLIVFAIVFYFFTAFRRHFKRFKADSFVYKVGSFGEEFYDHFIALLHSKKRIYLLLSGILVLHLLTDIGNFIVPYILGISGFLYLPKFDANHTGLLDLFNSNVAGACLYSWFIVFAVYLLNILAVLLLLFLPSYIWYRVYKRKGFKVSNLALAIFYCSLLAFLFSPVFKFIRINSGDRVGIDIQTSAVAIQGLDVMFLIAFSVGIAVYWMCRSHMMKEIMIALSVIIIDIFVAYYTYGFFIGNVRYYIDTAKQLFAGQYMFIPFVLLVFLLITCIFYLLAFLVYIAETKKEFRYIK
jgi:hypothetical protein